MKRFVFGLLTTLLLASPALASPINCSTNVAACDAIELGGGPYVRFVDNVFNRYIDIASPYSIIEDIQTAGVSHNAGIGSLATGTLRLYSESLSTYQGSSHSALRAQDVFTVTGPGSGLISITADFRANGTANLIVSPNDGGIQDGGAAGLTMCGPGGSFACGGDSFSRGGFPPSFVAYNGAITSDNSQQAFLDRLYTFDVTIGTPFTMSYELAAFARNGSTIDMLHTGNLSFTLPNGYTIRSLGGFGVQDVPPVTGAVPEPATWTLVALGLALAGRRFRKNRRSN